MKNLSFVFLAAGMAACGGSFGETSLRPAGSTLGVGALRAPIVYVSDHANNVIDAFDGRGKLRYTLTSGVNKPVGLFVDGSHNLWVANPGANDVLVFPRGSKTPSESLNDSNQPNDVAVCQDGTAFVADSLNLGGVAVYPPGHTNPVRRLIAQQSGAGGIEFYVTCDAAGNIFATGLIGLSPFPATTGWRNARQSGYYLLQPAAWSDSGIKARAGKLLIVRDDSHSQPAVEEFTESGKPTGRLINTGSDLWSDIALASRDGLLGAITPAHVAIELSFPGNIFRHEYGGSKLTQPEGVAFDPGDF